MFSEREAKEWCAMHTLRDYEWRDGKIVPYIGSVGTMTPHSNPDASDDGKADGEALSG